MIIFGYYEFEIIFYILLGTCIFYSCDHKQSEIDFEKSVFNEIFPKLIDSLSFDVGVIPPPPPMPIFNDEDSLIGIDTTGQGDLLKKYNKRKKELESDKTEKVLAIQDTIYEIDGRVNYQLQNHFDSYNLKIDSLNKSGYKINLSELEKFNNFKYKYRSEFPKGTFIWKKDYDFRFSGILRFSRISFDKSKKFAIMEGSFSCGPKCWFSGTIFIKKKNGVWIIEDIIVTSVS